MSILTVLVLSISLPIFLTQLLIPLEKSLSYPLYYLKSTIGISKIKPQDSYKILLVGDSMTEFMGNNEKLEKYLKTYYPNKKFEIINYGFGSTNILSLPDRINKKTQHAGKIFDPISTIPFDLIIIESFGNNPLSQYPLDQGLIKHNQTLDEVINNLTKSHPQSEIIFLSTIAPLKTRYAEGVINLTPEEKLNWVNERVAYIQNHIDYAIKNQFPLINLYQQSLKNGDGNIDYINTNDFIHPSTTGIDFISQQIADYIFLNRILPL